MPSRKITIWVVTPNEDSTYDEWWGPCETGADHAFALAYAQERLENIWDQYNSADPREVRVTLQQRRVAECDVPWYVEEAPDEE